MAKHSFGPNYWMDGQIKIVCMAKATVALLGLVLSVIALVDLARYILQ